MTPHGASTATHPRRSLYALVESVDGEEGFRYFATGSPSRLESLRAGLERELGLPLLVVPIP